jgi:hypothetical protein
MALFLAGTFYATAALAGYVVNLLFGAFGLIPDRATALLPTEGITWNYTTSLNIVFLVLAAALVVGFVRTGGMSMLAAMSGRPPARGTSASTAPGSASSAARRRRRVRPFRGTGTGHGARGHP